MTVLEWSLLGTFIGTIVFLLVSMLFLFLFFLTQKKLKEVERKKTKKRKKREVQKKEIKKLTKEKKVRLATCFVFLLISFILGGVSGYISYYQSVNLSEDDSKNVVEAYYLLVDFEKQLQAAENETNNAANVTEAIRKYASQMASFNSRKASQLNKEEGQLLLNRYYNVIKEIGVNSSNQSGDFYGNKELSKEFFEDVRKAKESQKLVFDYYKVSEQALKKDE